ncbi:unnamed protein product [Xylocopa violacea]|uniref:Odorant receptor n=1 Tax=Xylocopa violacea TaxID=135666 RepID=A0ABP1NCQ5_XYLVO
MTSKKKKDLSLIVTSFYMKIIGFWMASNNAERFLRKFAMFYTVIALLIAIVFELRDIYFTWGDFGELLSLVRYAKTNFWHSNYDPHEQLIMDSCKHTCTYLVCIFTFFAQGTVISYIIRPIVANIGRNESERMLPFNMWLNLPLSITPYFEVAFVIQVLSLYHVGVCYLCFDNFLCIINLHTAGQFRMLQYRFANMCDVNNHEKYYENSEKSSNANKYALFTNFIRQHQALIAYCKKLEKVFSLMVLGQVLLFSLLMCLDGYLVLMDDAPLTKRLIFAFHIAGCMCQLLMFTYSCDCLIRESMNVANAGYESSWSLLSMDKYGKMLRKDLLLVIMRSNLPCCLTASGFFVVSLETYTGILSTAVSYFTLLRHQIEVPSST